MAKYWATCAAGLEFTVVKELERLEGTYIISDSLFFGGVLFQTSYHIEELLELRSMDNIYAFVAHFQGVPSEKEVAIAFFKELAIKIDWTHSFDIFREWNKCKVGDFLVGSAVDGDERALLFRVSCDRTCTNMGRHGFTSVDAEAAIGEGIHCLFGWPASMRLYNLEVVAWIRDAEILLAIALLSNWSRRTEEVSHTCCHQDVFHPVSNQMDPSVDIRTSTELGGIKLKPRPRRVDSQLYARRLYRKALVETSLKPSTAFSLLQLAEVQAGHLIIDPMCGCGTIPFEAAESFGGEAMCLAGDIAHKAVAAAGRNLEDLKDPCDVLHWDATHLPLRTGCVDRIICDMPFGVRCGSVRVCQWLCPKVLTEMIRVLALETGIAVLMIHGKVMRKELEINQKPFLRLLKHLHIQMEGIRVELFVMQRTREPSKSLVSHSNDTSIMKKGSKPKK